MAMGRIVILEKVLLLGISYYASGDCTFHTNSYEFYANSDDDYPSCIDLNTTLQ